MLKIQAKEHVAVVVVDNMEQMVSFAVSYFNFVLQRNRESVALLRLIALQIANFRTPCFALRDQTA